MMVYLFLGRFCEKMSTTLFWMLSVLLGIHVMVGGFVITVSVMELKKFAKMSAYLIILNLVNLAICFCLCVVSTVKVLLKQDKGHLLHEFGLLFLAGVVGLADFSELIGVSSILSGQKVAASLGGPAAASSSSSFLQTKIFAAQNPIFSFIGSYILTDFASSKIKLRFISRVG